MGLGFFVLTVTIAISGYLVAGWDLLSAVYMVVITVFGVGFGEVIPLDTPELKIFTIFVIIAGCSSMVYFVGGFVQMLTEGEIQRAVGEHRHGREIDKLEKHIIICGFGRLGQPLAAMLKEAKHSFVIVDTGAERVAMAREAGYLVVVGNATEDRTLLAAGIERAKVLATVLPDDAANVFITLTARSLNPAVEIIARGEVASTEQKLRAAGAKHVVLPADIGAVRIAHMITKPSAVEFLDQNESRASLNSQLEQIDLRIDQMPIASSSPLRGKRLHEVEILGDGAFLIIGIKRADESIIANPAKDFVLAGGDTLIIVGHREDIPRFAAKYGAVAQVYVRGVKV
jgi:voltage-gated potassium channel